MEAKKKAEELVKKFDDLLPCEGTTTGQTPIDCALIAVDEIINTGALGEVVSFANGWGADNLYFWQSVKEEITKL